MAEQTSNHDWTIPTVGGDTNTWGQILNDFFDGELDEQVTLEGPYSERPSAANGNVKLYLATDRRIVYYNDGSSWEAVYGLGTDSNPVPGTSHFESLSTGDLTIANIGTVLEQTSSQTVSDTTQTQLTWDNSVYDDLGAADVANNQIKIQEDGVYLIRAIIAFETTITDFNNFLILVNGNNERQFKNVGSLNNFSSPSIQRTMSLLEGDTITVEIRFENGGSSANTVANPAWTSFEANLLGQQ
jgi:hypothetical protein